MLTDLDGEFSVSESGMPASRLHLYVQVNMATMSFKM
jgi:hypothetical protein